MRRHWFRYEASGVFARLREEHDIFRPELIQWLGLLRNMSCSSSIALFS